MEKMLPQKALTIAVERFICRGGARRLHAIFMNQLCIIWEEQEELSSTSGFRLPQATDGESAPRGRIGTFGLAV